MKLKKRLPALFLALFLAFFPLMLAIPVNADSGVLSEPGTFFVGSADTVYGYLNVRLSAPVIFPNAVAYVDFDQNLELITWPDDYDLRVSLSLVSDDFETPVYELRIYPWTEDTFTLTRYSLPVSLSDLPSDISLYLSDESPIVTSKTSQFSTNVILPFATEQHAFSASFYPLQYFSAPDVTVLSVFSGVSSWLGGAVNNMIPMFYTAESGLTVLGVLAVASLAFAFILLLLYLIAGWLNFR